MTKKILVTGMNDKQDKKIENKLCPLLNRNCLQEECQLWVEEHYHNFEHYSARCGLEHKNEGLFG